MMALGAGNLRKRYTRNPCCQVFRIRNLRRVHATVNAVLGAEDGDNFDARRLGQHINGAIAAVFHTCLVCDQCYLVVAPVSFAKFK